MKTLSNPWRQASGTVLALAVLAAVGWLIWHYGDAVGLDNNGRKIQVLLLVALLVAFVRLLPTLSGYIKRLRHRETGREQGVYPDKESRLAPLPVRSAWVSELRQALRARYGFFWRRKVRILMLMGEPMQVDAIAPKLVSQQWLEGEGTVLLWGGAAAGEPDRATLKSLRALRRRPLDGLVWVTDGYSPPPVGSAGAFTSALDGDALDNIARSLVKRYELLGWQVPLYVWALQHSAWDQSTRVTQPVGCLLPPRCQPEELAASLATLPPQLIEQGTQQVLKDPRHDFLLRLADTLLQGGIERLQTGLAVFMNPYRPLPVAGVMFSLPLIGSGRTAPHSWGTDNSWQTVLESVKQLPAALLPKRVGFAWLKTVRWCLAVLMLAWGAGMVVSYMTNRTLISESAEQARLASDVKAPLAERLRNQQALQQTVAMLQYREARGAPWYARLGLNQNAVLLQSLWPWYERNNNLLIRDAAAEVLHGKLMGLIALQPDSPQRAQQAKVAYEQLKAYLMMARPDKADPALLSKILQSHWSTREGVPQGVWHAVAPSLLGFYAQNLPAHPEWKIAADDNLVRDVRQILLKQLGVRNAEATLYQKMLQQVAKTRGDINLAQMVGDTDASLLFSTEMVVPGVFSRKAWENDVSVAIDKVVNQRREEIDWVLSDSQHTPSSDLSPEALKARLTERYFTDFAGSWLEFLNSIEWKPANSLSDSIDQLTLMADVRQSPLIALMNTLAYEGKTGQTGAALSDSLVKSAKTLFNGNEQPAIDQDIGIKSPMDSTFGPLLALMDGKAGGQGNTNLSLQTFLTRVTRVRLKLQQVTNATDPQGMTQSLAQTVFQGKSIDLTDTRDYGSLVAASLGQEWNSFAQALFVQPMDQSWQQVLMPTAESLNSQWKAAIVDDWNSAFGGRYPFKNVASDVSLPLLSQYLRADSGRIQRFLESRLAGVLHKEGSRWVPDSINAQGLNFNPAFLEAVNTLSHLADVVFTNGEAGMYFELRPETAGEVMQTDLIIDDQKLSYFNQMPNWKRFNWPADTSAPGATLSWVSTKAGTRLYADLPGAWGLIRLLDLAKVAPNPGVRSSFSLRWTAQDGLPLNYTLRTELDEGPLALLKLKGFVLPEQIFLTRPSVGVEQ